MVTMFHVAIFSGVLILVGTARYPDGIQEGPSQDGLEVHSLHYSVWTRRLAEALTLVVIVVLSMLWQRLDAPVYFVSFGQGRQKVQWHKTGPTISVGMPRGAIGLHHWTYRDALSGVGASILTLLPMRW